MSYPSDDFPGQRPHVDVNVRNWPANQEAPKRATKTVVKTYIVDPAATGSGANNAVYQQLCAYEPTRTRVLIKPWDAAITVWTQIPMTAPDASTSSTAPGGGYIAASDAANPWEFKGCDALWICSTGTITRVTVVKEYE